MSVSRMLNIGESALYAFQLGLEVTSNNISNAANENYSRKRVAFTGTVAGSSTYGLTIGNGVSVSAIQVLRNENLINDYHEQHSQLIDYQTRQTYLTEIESLLNPDEDSGLTTILESFWDSWDDLANNPDGNAERLAVINTAETLSSYFNIITASLDSIAADLEINLNTGVGQINTITKEIAELNEQIRLSEIDGSTDGTLRDLRDDYLDELSELVGYTYFEDTDGTITINLENGKPLVQGANYWTLSVDSTDPRSVVWSGDGSEITSSLTGGQMGAWAEVLESVIPQFQENLDELANGIVWQVNQLHSQGVGLEAFSRVASTYEVADADAALASEESGLTFYDQIEEDGFFNIVVYDSSGKAVSYQIDVTDETTLNDLAGSIDALDNITATVDSGKLIIEADNDYTFAFSSVSDYDEDAGTYTVNSSVLAALGINTFWSGSGAGGFEVNDTVASDSSKLATGLIDNTTGEHNTGDNSNALVIAKLRDTSVSMTLTEYTLSAGATTQATTTTLSDFLSTIVSQIGVLNNDASVNVDYHEMLLEQVDTMVASEGGVNMDEELVDLLAFQRAYQGAARIITTADEILQTLLEM